MVVLLIILFGGIWDGFTGKIPNWLTLPSIILGLILGVKDNHLYMNLFGLFVGISIYWPLFYFGFMGGGDVKFMGAIGCLIGASGVLYTAVFAGLWGGLLAVIAMLKKQSYVRYGVAIALGYLTLEALQWLN